MSGEPTSAPPAPSARSAASSAAHWKRRSRAVAIPRDEAVRQGAISQLAFQLLGREAAIAFLNTEHTDLGGRPLELATASAKGREAVEAELARMASPAARSSAHSAATLPSVETS